MKMYGKIFSGLFLFILSIPTVKAGDLKILVSDDRTCQFEFSPEDIQIDTVVAGEVFHRISFRDAGSYSAPGEPQLPARPVIIGLPPGAHAQVSASASGYETYSSIHLIPAPRLEKTGSFREEVHETGPAYNQAGWTPASLIETGEPGMMGDLRVVHIRISPVQYDPLARNLRVYKKITVHVRFEGEAPSAAESPGAVQQAAIDRLVLNAGQAGHWAVRPAILKKQTGTFGPGPWYKIPVTEEAIYRIEGSTLENKGIDLSGLDISTLKVYNNGGRMLPRNINTGRSESLIELPLLVEDGGDGRLDSRDAILFYGKGVAGYQYDTTGHYLHYTHLYTDENIYWLTFNDGKPGKRVSEAGVTGNSPIQVSTTPDLYFYEEDLINPIEAGIQWFAQQFSEGVNEKSYSFSLNNPVPSQTLSVNVRFRGDSKYRHTFGLSLNNQTLPSVTVSGMNFRESRLDLPVSNLGESNQFTIRFSADNASATAFMDWFEIGYERPLQAESDRLFFSSPAEQGAYQFQLSGFSGSPSVWNVTEPADAVSLPVVQSGSAWTCTADVEAGMPQRYVAFRSPSAISLTNIVQDDQVSDLRNPSNEADMIILTHRLFNNPAERLEEMRETRDNLDVRVVDIQDVYDEFGWGLPDPVAIRDFMSSAWLWQKHPQYLLLFGDASYVYKTPEGPFEGNLISTYEVDSDDVVNASAVDEYFSRVAGDDADPDIAVGRLPVRTEEEGDLVVDKIIRYETEGEFGAWKNTITLAADDVKKNTDQSVPSEMTHVKASEDIYKSRVPKSFNVRKIYLTDYEEVIEAGGRRKPGAKEDLFEQINRGTLIVNWIGHGNESVWAHELVLSQPGDVSLFENQQLPLFFGATCTFARFDLEEDQSLAEWLFMMENGGSIASVGATRECFADQNESLDKKFLEILLEAPYPRVGEALRLAKLYSGDVVNDQKYTLLGDPAMRLANPKNSLSFTEMSPDSFKALSLFEVSGKADTISGFQGSGLLTAFDSEKPKTFSFTDQSQNPYSINYTLPGNTIFRGEISISGGAFHTGFVVPKDISYGQNTGRLSVYGYTGETDASGYINDIPVGGSTSVQDSEGPEITLYFTENPGFVTGGMVLADPELTAEIRDDKTGINITGEIGHKLILTVDETDITDVTGYFQYDPDSYMKGKMRFDLSGLGEGSHSLTLKAWDNANNSSMGSLVFQIVPRGSLRLEEVLNYPNPFRSGTHFTFQVSYPAEIGIRIYTVDGRLIQHLEGIQAESGFNMIAWDGHDSVGDLLSNGVYLYRVDAEASVEGKTVKVSQMNKLMIYR